MQLDHQSYFPILFEVQCNPDADKGIRNDQNCLQSVGSAIILDFVQKVENVWKLLLTLTTIKK